MRLNWRISILGCLLAGSLMSCEEEFDPNGDYVETAVIYAMLDSSQPVQYVKVNKAYLNTNSNALYIAANNPDSTQFYDPIRVEIQKIRPGADSLVLATYTLHPDTINDKAAGNFYYPQQVVYASDMNQIQLEDNGIYRVEVTNTNTGKKYRGSTRIVESFCIVQVGYNPMATCTQPLPPQPLAPHNYLRTRFDLAKNGAIYEATYYINYYLYPNGGQDSSLKTIEFTPIISEQRAYTTTGYIEKLLEPMTIYEVMNSRIDVSNDNASTYRKMAPGYVKVTAGGNELKEYIVVNNVYSAITQTRPEYSNVQNGTGVISSRRTQTVNTFFTADAVDTLITLYPQLKFQR